jgi:hypothetical protein
MHSFYIDHEFWFYYVIHRLETVRVRYTNGGDNPIWEVGDLNITYHNGMADFSHKMLVCGIDHISTRYTIIVYSDEHENYAYINMNIHVRRIGDKHHLIIKVNNRKPFKWIVDDDISNDVYYNIKLAYA